MNLNGRDLHGLDGIQERNAGVRIGTGVDDNAVCPVQICFLNFVNEVTLVVGLIANCLNSKLTCVSLYHLDKPLVGGISVVLRLPNAQKVEIGAVDDIEFHCLKNSFLMRSATSSMLPSPSIRQSAVAQ